MTEEEVLSVLAELIEPEVGQCLALQVARRLWRVAKGLGLEDSLAVIVVAYDVRRYMEERRGDDVRVKGEF